MGNKDGEGYGSPYREKRKTAAVSSFQSIIAKVVTTYLRSDVMLNESITIYSRIYSSMHIPLMFGTAVVSRSTAIL